jgi:hypothetical protein
MNILTDILGLAKRRMFAKQVFPSDVMVIGINKDPDMTGVASPIPYKHCKLIRFRDLKVNYNLVLDSNCPEIPLPGEGQIFWKQEPDPSTNIMTNYFRSIRSLSPGILNINISPDDCYVELTCLAEANLAANVGSGVGIWKDKVGVVLNFKSLLAGDGIQITDGLDEITITSLAMQTLTTIGTTGASTLVGTTLNIPIYQGQITLTTIGTTGVSTLIGDVLNIPTYQGEITLTNLGPYGNATLIGDVLNIPTYDLSLTTNGVSGASTLTVDALGNDVLNIPIYVPDGLTAMTSFTIEGNSGVTLTMDNLDQLDIVGQGTTANPLSTDYYGINTVTTIVSPTNSKVEVLLSDTPVVPGAYTTPNLTVNQQGQIIAIEDGTSCSLIVNEVCDCSLPNETDVYVMIDTTSGPYAGPAGCAVANRLLLCTAVLDWHNNFIAANPNYTGNLYVYEYPGQSGDNQFNEDYAFTPVQIWNGSAGANHTGFIFVDPTTGTALPQAQGAGVPPNWSFTSTPDPNWTPPTEVLFIAFVNESAPQYHFQSTTSTSISLTDFVPGYSAQPTVPFTNNRNATKDIIVDPGTGNYNYTFFRGVVYPAQDNQSWSLNFLLHAYAATTNVQYIQKTAFQTAVGSVNYASMIAFDSSFDSSFGSTGILNPYWNANPLLVKGLWSLDGVANSNFKYTSILDKYVDTSILCPPNANLSFTSVDFSKELDAILGVDCDCVSLVDSWDPNTCELGLRSIRSCSLDITVDDGCINIEEKGTCFEDSNTINFKSNNGIITAFVQDTDWHPLNGFDWYFYAGPDFSDPNGLLHPIAGSTYFGRDDRPHARRIGNQIHFRGQAIVPLENDAGIDALPWDYNISINTNTYSKTARTAPFTGGAASSPTSFNGVVVDTNGQIIFNRQQEFIPNAVLPLGMHIDSAVVHPLQMTGRYISAYTGTLSNPTFSTVGSVLSTTIRPIIQMIGNTRILKLQAIRDQEQSSGNQSQTSFGTSIWNNVNTHVKAGDYFAQYGTAETTMAGAPNPPNVLTNVVGATGTTLQFNGAVQPLQLTYLTNYWYPVDFDGGDVEKLGGIFMQLDGMTAFISPCADLIPTPEPCSYDESYNCCNGRCLDPGTGTGIYRTLDACLKSGCDPGPPVTKGMSFSLSVDCSGPTQVVNANNIQGGIGPYEWGNTVFLTYQAATQNTNWTTPGATSIAYGVANGATYYVALRDSSNPQNIVVSDAVVNCTTPPPVTPSWDCDGQGNCSDPGDGSGTYSTLAACQTACIVPSWNCDNCVCTDPNDGSGTYSTLTACEDVCDGFCGPFTDDVFRSRLEGEDARGQGEGPVLTANDWVDSTGGQTGTRNYMPSCIANTVTELYVPWSTGPKITSLDGIECFINLDRLECQNNSISTLDLSSNINLTYCVAYQNTISSLDVASNPNLIHLHLAYNQLSTVNLSNNTALTFLSLDTNLLTVLSVSTNTSLTNFACGNNNLSTIDVSMLSDLYSFYCAGNVLITGLNLTNNTVLDTLDCANCDINSLNLNTNTLLTTLTCQSNQLTSLDVSQNTALTKLYCHTNSITNLDVSMLTSLDWFRCEVNGMLTLNIANGNNANMPANKFDARQYPDPTTLVITCDTPANPHAVYTVAAGCITNGTTFN